MGFPPSLKLPEMSCRNYCEYTDGSQIFYTRGIPGIFALISQ
jgi:hypothetical protein